MDYFKLTPSLFKKDGTFRFNFRESNSISKSIKLVDVIFHDVSYYGLKLKPNGNICFESDNRTEFCRNNANFFNDDLEKSLPTNLVIITRENEKSDIDAKESYKAKLMKSGIYESVRIADSPADIIAVKSGIEYYFEIKTTKTTKRYFGAATLTEWKQAMETSDRYKFVVAIPNKSPIQDADNEYPFLFTEFTPEAFMEFSTVPPFKVFFNIHHAHLNSNTEIEGPTRRKKNEDESKGSIKLSDNRLSFLVNAFNKVREIE